MVPTNEGFTCVSCKRYFYSHYFDTGLGGCYIDDENGNPIIDENGELMRGGDATDGHIMYFYCAFCDRKGGNSPDNPFFWDDKKVAWPYPEDITNSRSELQK